MEEIYPDMEVSPSSWSWLTGAIAGALASILVTPITTWLQESMRRNKEARSKALAQAVVFKNEVDRVARNRDELTINEIFDLVAQLAAILNSADIDRFSQNRVYAKLESISSKVWVDFFKTCPSETGKQEIYDRLGEAVGGYGLNQNDYQLKEAIIKRNMKLQVKEVLKSLDEIVVTLTRSPFRVRLQYYWNYLGYGKDGRYQ
ncbi:MAG: hypothetical protein C75L2_00550057 [Leptospirillum sp. Group II 'C75']|nr:MAG: hypothetical protein C75L2_00550057 [Leptospirillum sp. Group II 'C75']